MKNKKTILLLAIISIIGILVYLYFRYRSSVSIFDVTNTAKVTSDTTGTSSTSATDSFPLKKGAKGARVKQLQQWINKQAIAMKVFTSVPNTPLVVDGIWGAKTDAALLKISGYGWNGVNATKANIYPAVSEAFYITYCVPLTVIKTISGLEIPQYQPPVNDLSNIINLTEA